MYLHKRKNIHPVPTNHRQTTKPSHSGNKKKQTQKTRLTPSSSTILLNKKNHDYVKNEQDLLKYVNENEDNGNITTKRKRQDKMIVNQKKSRSHSKKQMKKSASYGKIIGKTTRRKSISPMLTREENTSKNKYQNKKVNKTDRSKKNKKTSKGFKSISQKTTRNQSQHLKTQISSKMPSVSKELEEKKFQRKKSHNNKKINKSKETFIYPLRKEKKKGISFKQKLQNSILFSQEESEQKNEPFMSEQIIAMQNFFMKNERNLNLEETKRNKAAILIQKNFRGYLTRKYLEEIKFMLHSIIKIQKVWRGFFCRKQLKKCKDTKKQKNMLSIENSLITIKDFSEETQQKMKEKHFNFKIEQIVEKKSIKDDIIEKKAIFHGKDSKIINILESLLEQEQLNEKIKDKIRNSLAETQNKQKIQFNKQCDKRKQYVKNRINSQILSEKSFNSPRGILSPKITNPLNSPAQILQQNSIDMYESPRKISDSNIMKRISSPVERQQSIKKFIINTNQQLKTAQLLPFDASFPFLEEFCLSIVDIIRDSREDMTNFLNIINICKKFRINMVLSGWDKFTQTDFADQPIFAQLDFLKFPQIFSKSQRQKIFAYPTIKLLMEEGNYHQEDLNQQQSICENSFKHCIFDGFTEAIYLQFRDYFLPFQKQKITIEKMSPQKMFCHVILHAVLQLRKWCESLCGQYFPNGFEEDLEYNRAKRMEEMLKEDEKNSNFYHCQSWEMWVQIMLGEIIFQEIVMELGKEILQNNFL